MSFWFEYVESRCEPSAVRELAQLDDDNLRFFMAAWVCNIAAGVELPAKASRTELAKRLIKKDYSRQDVLRLTGISERHYFRLKEKQDG